MTSTNVVGGAPIQDPFPIPVVGTVFIRRSRGEKIGISFSTRGESCAVLVSAVAPNSLSATVHPPLRVGQEILAINGIAVHSARQAINVIQSFADLEFTTLDRNQNNVPCCYVEVAPTSKINPGVSFGSCLNRSLVTIGQVFVKADTTRLRTGDIVLAVNGVPVWKPEQADMEQLVAARNGKALVLYCVDLDKLCDSAALYAQVTKKAYGDTRRVKIVKKSRGQYSLTEHTCCAVAKIDIYSSDIVVDETEVANLVKQVNAVDLGFKDSYAHFCRPAILSFRELLKGQLQFLLSCVVKQAWPYSIKQSEDMVSIFVVPSAPVAPVAIATSGADVENELPLAMAVALEEDVRFDI